jgi:hypothetical protein
MSRFGRRTALRTVTVLLADLACLGWLMLQSHTNLAAENVHSHIAPRQMIMKRLF